MSCFLGTNFGEYTRRKPMAWKYNKMSKLSERHSNFLRGVQMS